MVSRLQDQASLRRPYRMRVTRLPEALEAILIF